MNYISYYHLFHSSIFGIGRQHMRVNLKSHGTRQIIRLCCLTAVRSVPLTAKLILFKKGTICVPTFFRKNCMTYFFYTIFYLAAAIIYFFRLLLEYT